LKVTHSNRATVLTFDQESQVCRALTARYSGLVFHEVIVAVLGAEAVEHYSGDDAVEVGYTLTGPATALLRHGFARRAWLAPYVDESVREPVDGCYAWSVECIEGGDFHITRARYADGLSKLCAVLFPTLWLDVCSRFTR